MSEEILNKILDLAVETRGKLEALDRLEPAVKEIASTIGAMQVDISNINTRLDRVETRLDNIESELGTVKVAVLDVSRTVKEHDHAIRELKERYH